MQSRLVAAGQEAGVSTVQLWVAYLRQVPTQCTSEEASPWRMGVHSACLQGIVHTGHVAADHSSLPRVQH